MCQQLGLTEAQLRALPMDVVTVAAEVLRQREEAEARHQQELQRLLLATRPG